MSRTLRTIAGILSERWRAPSTCAKCGAQFGCGASLSGCWCAEVQLSAAARQELSQKYNGCLCPGCLEQFAEIQEEGDDAKPKWQKREASS